MSETTTKKQRVRTTAAVTTPEVEDVLVDVPMDVAEDVVVAPTKTVSVIPDKPVATRPSRETFIVQNVTPGPHCVSDIKLTFDPFQIIDLTYEDSEMVLGSRALKKSLQCGILRRITAEEADAIQTKEIERSRQKMIREQKMRQRQQSVVESEDGRQFEAEVTNINAGQQGREEVTTTGHVNDAMTYAMAYAKASAAAKRQGKVLDPEEFAQKLGNDNRLLNQLAFDSGNVDAESASGDMRRGRVTYAVPDDEGNIIPLSVDMTNFNRDRRVAGHDSFDLLMNDAGVSETIDLNLEDEMASDARVTRRR